MMQQRKDSIVYLAENYISRILTENLPSDLLFHNLHHTFNVVRGAREISNHLRLNDEAQEILFLAAWFHDCGHVTTYEGHEVESQRLAKVFLESHKYPKQKIVQVLSCIAATQMPQRPVGLMEEIICDADLYHLSLDEYPHLQNLLRTEWSLVFDKEYTDEEWRKENFYFLENHTYFTSYGQKVLQKRKEDNILILSKIVR